MEPLSQIPITGYIILSEAKAASDNQFAAQKTCLLSEAENMLPISYITESVFFPTQIIVTNELDGELHTWLKPLSDSAGEEDMRRLLRKTSRLEGKLDKELADSVLEVSVKANRQLVEKLIGDDDMSQALFEIMEPRILEIMEPVLLEREKQAETRAKKEGIQGSVNALRTLGHGDNEIKTVLMEQYHLSEEETKEYL